MDIFHHSFLRNYLIKDHEIFNIFFLFSESVATSDGYILKLKCFGNNELISVHVVIIITKQIQLLHLCTTKHNAAATDVMILLAPSSSELTHSASDTPFDSISCVIVGVSLANYNLISFLIHQESYSKGY